MEVAVQEIDGIWVLIYVKLIIVITLGIESPKRPLQQVEAVSYPEALSDAEVQHGSPSQWYAWSWISLRKILARFSNVPYFADSYFCNLFRLCATKAETARKLFIVVQYQVSMLGNPSTLKTQHSSLVFKRMCRQWIGYTQFMLPMNLSTLNLSKD